MWPTNSPGPVPYHATSTHGPASSSSSASAPSHTAPCTTSPQFHLPGLPAAGNVDNSNADNENLDDESGGWLGTQGEEDDNMIVNETADSLSHAAGKERQLPSSPSPPPDQFSIWHAEAVEPWGPTQITFGDIAEPINTFVNNTKHHLYIRLLYVPGSPDIMSDQCQHWFKEEKGKIRRDGHKCFITKLDVKKEYNWDVKRYKLLCANHEHEVSQAAVNHQRLQEANDAEIHLRETDI
ncbi:hypothetical protein BDR05DRAFT_1000409 [Suillus weaverae]|nr:hypothetical protein BDR05DRAFT_1000409 [Suillus weaverae]